MALSPLDDRYSEKIAPLINIFSEEGLMKRRIKVELEYFIYLVKLLPQLKGIDSELVRSIYHKFDYKVIKEIEKKVNHDVKAVEYFIKEEFDKLGLGKYKEFVHFALTSQDINSTAYMLQIRDYVQNILLPQLNDMINIMRIMASNWKEIPMLSRTHGQPATPTTLGFQFLVFCERLENQIDQLQNTNYRTKFGGATGGFNAHYVTYPNINWRCAMTTFIQDVFKMKRARFTTQIDHYDNYAEIFDNVKRINNILLDMAKDIWLYISFDYFKLKIKEGEVGSSAMPHKVNPIDFENAMGNFEKSNSDLQMFSNRLPVSMLQRELTDSTICRNFGVGFGHGYLAIRSLMNGIMKLEPNRVKIETDLRDNWVVVSEAIQNILRVEGYDEPYELLKEFTRVNNKPGEAEFKEFINNLKIKEDIKERLHKITPMNYIPSY